jgi:hypothetical protein
MPRPLSFQLNPASVGPPPPYFMHPQYFQQQQQVSIIMVARFLLRQLTKTGNIYVPNYLKIRPKAVKYAR